MKPLPVAPFTVEDNTIWWRMIRRHGMHLFVKYRESDRRDAVVIREWTYGAIVGLGGSRMVSEFPWVLAGTQE